MKKKLLISLLFVLLLFVVTGCGKKEEEEKVPELAEDEVIVNETLYKLNIDEEGYGLKYKIAENFRKWDSGNALNYFGKIADSSSSNFVIRIFHYANKNVDYAIKDTVEEYDKREEVELDGRKYTKVHFTNYSGDNTYLFYYVHNNDVYAYCFTAKVEQPRLESVFLKQVIYQ